VRIAPALSVWQSDDKPTPPKLTPRERQILHLLQAGKSNGDIATLLHRSHHTVKHQVSALLAKLNASDRNHAITRAVKLGLLPERRC
jgi:DNA-binding NarL/FixJ family response regulator